MDKRKTLRFSDELEQWLKSKKPKTIMSLNETFAEKGFAVAFLLLMLLPALPVPTAGHVLEVITIILALELVAGRRDFWLPKRLRDNPLGSAATKATGKILSLVRFFERFSRPRFADLVAHTIVRRLLGIVIIAFAVAAFFAPPLMDTFPAMGVVLIALGMLLDDIVFVIIGLLLGSIGIVLEVVFGKAALIFVKHLLHL